VCGQAYFITNMEPTLFWDHMGQFYQDLGYDNPWLELFLFHVVRLTKEYFLCCARNFIIHLFIMKVTLFLFASLSLVLAKPNGAPICKANATLVQAGMGPSTVADLGFTVTANPSSYSAGQPVTFTLSSTSQKTFKGLLIYVNKLTQPLLRSGKFEVPAGFQNGLGCNPTADAPFVNDDGASTITHTDESDKTLPFTLTWNPGMTSVGDLSIRAVVALAKTQWQVITPVPLPAGNQTASMGGSGWKKCVKVGAAGSNSAPSASSWSTAWVPSMTVAAAAADSSPNAKDSSSYGGY